MSLGNRTVENVSAMGVDGNPKPPVFCRNEHVKALEQGTLIVGSQSTAIQVTLKSYKKTKQSIRCTTSASIARSFGDLVILDFCMIILANDIFSSMEF